MEYRHMQFGWALVPGLLLIVVGTALAAILTHYWGLLACAGLMAIVTLLFCCLTVEVEGNQLRLRFGIGLVRRTVALDQVQDARAVRTSWLEGWGIHRTRRGWLWNVHGFGAVEITFADGSLFLIGSDEPDVLCAAIRRALRRPSQQHYGSADAPQKY